MSKYEALRQALEARAHEERVTLQFDELDAILGGQLPASARRHKTWWTNNASSQPHAACWLDTGRRAEPRFESGYAVFVRAAEGATPYQTAAPRPCMPRTERSHQVNPVPLAPGVSTNSLGEAALQVSFQWRHAGTIGWDGRPSFPDLTPAPGIYAFLFFTPDTRTARIYVGQAARLRGRMSGYRNPAPEGSGQQTNRRMNDEIAQHLATGGEVHLHIATEVLVGGVEADLSIKSLRGVFESAAMYDLSLRGFALLNR